MLQQYTVHLSICGAKPPCAAPNLLEPQGMSVLLSLKRPYMVAVLPLLIAVRLGDAESAISETDIISVFKPFVLVAKLITTSSTLTHALVLVILELSRFGVAKGPHAACLS